MTARSRCEMFWLGGRDSNPDSQIQSLESYHWTTSQRRIRIYGSLRFKSTEPFNGSCPALVFSARSQRPPRLCGEFAINALTAEAQRTQGGAENFDLGQVIKKLLALGLVINAK